MRETMQSAQSSDRSEEYPPAAAATNSQLRRIIDTIPVLAWCNLPDGSNEFLNRRWQDYTGLSQEEGYGGGWQVALHPDDLGALLDKWGEVLESGQAGEIEARIRRHDGVYRWFLIRGEPLRDELGKIVRWYGTSTDIDDLKHAHEELRRTTDAIPQMIVVQSPEGLPLYTNRVAYDYTGVSLEEVGAENWRARILHPEDFERTREERRVGLTRPVPFSIEQRARGRDGRYRWFLSHYNPLLDDEGKIVRWYSTRTDIDERKRAEERTRKENFALREEISGSSMFEDIVGSSAALKQVLSKITKVASTDSTVLITGETGTGKELVARAIHAKSKRAGRAFIRVSCAAIPQELITSELFGHEKGAFTGALQRRIGRFECADGGTIFLDEVGELPAETQVAILRVLQEREFERIGSNHPIRVDVRVLTATNRDLDAAVAAGKFRRDLFYRLNVFPIVVPSLRERADDIRLLVEHMLERSAKKAGKKIKRIEKTTLELFDAYGWPGNVRELQNIIERAVILCDGDTLSVDPNWFGASLRARATRTARA
jgi:formate hydrogenlyase transcriptional activator